MYSRSKAGRYIAAARCLKKYPTARILLTDRKITACGLSHIAGLLTDENAKTLFEEVSGKLYVEIEKIAASRRVAPKIRDSVRPIGKNPTPAIGMNGADSDDLFQSDPFASQSRSGTDCNAKSPPPEFEADSQNGTDPIESLRHRYEIRFSASEEFCRDLERAKRVCSRSWNLEAILGRALKDLLEKRDPERKEARRKKREAGKQSKSRGDLRSQSPGNPATVGGARSATEKKSSDEGAQASPARSRHIPSRLRDAVFTRDEGRCTYVSGDGIRCGSTAHLQIDHIRPFCRGGEHTLDNLRIYCGKHNRLAAREMSLADR